MTGMDNGVIGAAYVILITIIKIKVVAVLLISSLTVNCGLHSQLLTFE